MKVNLGLLRDQWESICKDIDRVIEKFEKLPDFEQDQELVDLLVIARHHARCREDAAIDPR